MALHDEISEGIELAQHKLLRWFVLLSRQRVSGRFPGKDRWVPPADVHETESAYHVTIELAGVDPSTIDLAVEGNVLRLSGERKRQPRGYCRQVHQLEIDYGMFEREIQFPSDLDGDGAQSVYRQGFLEIILPRKKPTDRV